MQLSTGREIEVGMSNGIAGNLMSAWGVEDDGHDPSKLPGLLALAEEWLEEEDNDPQDIVHHFESMKNRIVGAHVEREQALRSRSTQLDAAFIELVSKNLTDFEAVESCLERFIEGANTANRDLCWEGLGELEGASEELKESGEAIASFVHSGSPVCTRCASTGPELICPKCKVDRLALDPAPPYTERNEADVSSEVLDVFRAYNKVLNGEGTLANLINELQGLEFSLLEAQALAEQGLASVEDQDSATEKERESLAKAYSLLLQNVNSSLEGVEKIHGVVKNRSTTELNQGWRIIFENAVQMRVLLQNIKPLSQG